MFFFFSTLSCSMYHLIFRSKFPETGGGYCFSRPEKETETQGASGSSSAVCKSVALNSVEVFFFSLFRFSFLPVAFFLVPIFWQLL